MPAKMDAPAIPAVIDEDSPARSRARAKTTAAAGPTSGPSICLGLAELGDRRPAEEGRRGDQDHGAVDAPADDHGDERVGELVLELAPDDLLLAEVPLPALDDLGVQEEVVRHDHGAEDGHDDGHGAGRDGRARPRPAAAFPQRDVDQGELEEERQPDEGDEGDDPFLEARVGVREEQRQHDAEDEHGRRPAAGARGRACAARWPRPGSRPWPWRRRPGPRSQDDARRGRAQVLRRRLGQAQARGDAEVGDVVLEDDQHDRGQGDHPEEGIAVAAPAAMFEAQLPGSMKPTVTSRPGPI